MARTERWTPQLWQRYRKHLPPNSRTKGWAQLVRETGEQDATAYYHQDLRNRVERLETETLREGTLLSGDGVKRYYWAEFNMIIGASRGQETKFILVEHHVTGWFHGHPVTWEELKSEGAKHEDRESE